ncbi:MAG: Hsp20/alpha crystallin family protein, partial [Nitrospinales bacterium]
PNFERTLPPMKSFAFGGPFSQQFDLKEKDDRYILTLELPGLDETKLNVSVEEQTVKISGTMEQVEENKDKTSVVQSRRSSHFERYLTLPGPVKPESLQIDYDKNRLIIELDKA